MMAEQQRLGAGAVAFLKQHGDKIEFGPTKKFKN